MRIFFLGNNWLGWQTLKWLREGSDEIVGLAMHPEARLMYGNEIRKEVGNTNCLMVDGSRLKDAAVLEQVRKLEADIAVSVLFAYVVSADFIRLFRRGCINLHPALLPHNRGRFPNIWSIVEGTPAGVTLHYIDEGIDTGDVITQNEIEVEVTDTGETLYRRLESEGLQLFKAAWPSIREGTNARTRQAAGQGNYHRALDVEMIDEIDLEKSYRAEDLINLLRARTFPPYRGAYFVHEGRKIYLRLELKDEAELAGEQSSAANRISASTIDTSMTSEIKTRND
jgi:methionyl-tRNA formyltransferase